MNSLNRDGISPLFPSLNVASPKLTWTALALVERNRTKEDIVPNNSLQISGFMRLPEVLKLFPVSKSTWWLGVKEGRYPKPVKLGIKISAWRVDDIRSLINSTGGMNND